MSAASRRDEWPRPQLVLGDAAKPAKLACPRSPMVPVIVMMPAVTVVIAATRQAAVADQDEHHEQGTNNTSSEHVEQPHMWTSCYEV
jgi:hypothetical protein